jgi:hypothetical protein
MPKILLLKATSMKPCVSVMALDINVFPESRIGIDPPFRGVYRMSLSCCSHFGPSLTRVHPR